MTVRRREHALVRPGVLGAELYREYGHAVGRSRHGPQPRKLIRPRW